MPRLPTAAALLVALAGPPLFAALPDRWIGDRPSLAAQVVLQLLYCALPCFVVWVVIRVERLPLRSIGLRRPDASTVASGVLLWIAGAYLLPLVTAPLLDALGPPDFQAGLDRIARMPVWFRIVVAVSGGIAEETLYRGYAIERLSAITDRRWLAASISAVAFGLAHVPAWGIGVALGADLPFGILMTVFYLWRRDLLANILAHSLGLVVSMLTVVP